MSGSYDRPTGPPARTSLELDPYRDRTGPATVTHGRGTFDQTRTARPAAEERAPRSRRNEPGQTNAPIVPAGSVTGRSLTLVITIMCFLACLTAGAVYMINESASAWLKDIASEVTAQIEPRDGMDVEKTVREAEAFLRNHKGISRASALSLADSSKLLEPWLGQSDVLAALPVPRLIAVEIGPQRVGNSRFRDLARAMRRQVFKQLEWTHRFFSAISKRLAVHQHFESSQRVHLHWPWPVFGAE